MKRLIQISIILTLLLLSVGIASAADEVGVSIDGVQVGFDQSSGQPFIDENSRTQVPFRQTLEAFGATVDWDPDTRTAIAEKGGVIVKVPIGTDYIYMDSLTVMNDTKSLIKDSRTYLPIRIVLEAFGADVDWDAKTRTVLVKSDGEKLSLPILAAEATAAMSKIESVDIEVAMGVNISIPSADEKIDVSASMNISSFFSPVKQKAVGKFSVNGDDVTVETCTVQKGNTIVSYANQSGAGFEKVLEMDIDEYYNPFKNVSLSYLFPKFENKGTDTVNGAPTIKLEGKFSKELLNELLSSEVFESVLSNVMDESIALPAADIPVTIWVDAKSKTVTKLSLDMKGFILGFMGSILSESIGEDVSGIIGDIVTIDKALFEITLSNFDNATDFELPANLPE
ncbi:MAG: copper amine oxidase N-terminal domain-containing protein [Clostridiales bacterium]|nr:copper amine oxidase N-terminal domain-containing protein [Clostridiales bacterium]